MQGRDVEPEAKEPVSEKKGQGGDLIQPRVAHSVPAPVPGREPVYSRRGGRAMLGA